MEFRNCFHIDCTYNALVICCHDQTYTSGAEAPLFMPCRIAFDSMTVGMSASIWVETPDSVLPRVLEHCLLIAWIVSNLSRSATLTGNLTDPGVYKLIHFNAGNGQVKYLQSAVSSLMLLEPTVTATSSPKSSSANLKLTLTEPCGVLNLMLECSHYAWPSCF